MPNFKENKSPAMKKSAYKMKGYTYPGTSPMTEKRGKAAVEDIASGGGKGPNLDRLNRALEIANKQGNQDLVKKITTQIQAKKKLQGRAQDALNA